MVDDRDTDRLCVGWSLGQTPMNPDEDDLGVVRGKRSEHVHE
jgi:hypothetical protein